MKKTIISVTLALVLALSFMSASVLGEGDTIPQEYGAEDLTAEDDAGSDTWDTVGKISGTVLIVLALVTAAGFALKSKKKK